MLEDNKFVFDRNITLSYRPEGNYSIKKDKLILYVADDEEYIFNIKNHQLVFVSGPGVGEFMAEGTVFKLSKSDMYK